MSDATLTAGLVGVIIILAKVIEFFMKKNHEKKNGSRPVSLHPEVSRQIRETYEALVVAEDIKYMKKHNEKMADALGDMAKCLERVAESQQKTAETLDKIDRRQEVEDEVRRRAAANE